MTETRKDRIKRLVAALLNDNGRTPEEAAEARRKAAQLMAENDLTMEEVTAEERRMRTGEVKLSRHGWIVLKCVGASIAHLTCTRNWVVDVYTDRGGRTDRKLYKYAGYDPDVDWAEWLTEHVLEVGKREARPFVGDRPKSDFLYGFATRVSQRIYELAESLETARAEVGCKDLVVAKQAMVEDFVAEMDLNLRTMNSSKTLGDVNAFGAGKEAGDRVGLSRPVDASGPKLIGAR